MSRIHAALLSALMLWPTAAGAEGLFLAGASKGATSDYAFAGAILPLPGQRLGQGYALRLWSDYLDYTYAGGPGTITASGWGGALAGVYQFSGDWGWSSLSAGVAFRHTVLSINDPGNSERGSKAHFNLQADGGYNLDPHWRLRGLGSYTPDNRAYLLQAGIDRTIWGEVRLGLSVMLQGDRNYSQVSGGVTAYIPLSPGIELAPSIGASQGGGKTAPYGSLTLVMTLN
jgi:hypothetical protein